MGLREFKLLIWDDHAYIKHHLQKRYGVEETLWCYEVRESGALFDTLLDEHIDAILINAAFPQEKILQTLTMIQSDSLCQYIPVIMISEIEPTYSFAKALADFPVITIFSYAGWEYQLLQLVSFLKIKSDDVFKLNSDLIQTEEDAIIDPLTGIFNRRGGEKKYESFVRYYLSHGENFALVMMDADHFKSINDTYGHDVGDEVLVEMPKLIQEHLRKDDQIVRFGGEEFFILLANCSLPAAVKKAERLRELVSSVPFSSKALKVTASFGVVEYKEGKSLEALIKYADTFLYQAKSSGRNRVCAEPFTSDHVE